MKKNSLRASVNTRPSKKLVTPPLPLGKTKKDENNNSSKSMGEPLVVKTIFGGAPSTSKGAGSKLSFLPSNYFKKPIIIILMGFNKKTLSLRSVLWV